MHCVLNGRYDMLWLPGGSGYSAVILSVLTAPMLKPFRGTERGSTEHSMEDLGRGSRDRQILRQGPASMETLAPWCLRP